MRAIGGRGHNISRGDALCARTDWLTRPGCMHMESMLVLRYIASHMTCSSFEHRQKLSFINEAPAQFVGITTGRSLAQSEVSHSIRETEPWLGIFSSLLVHSCLPHLSTILRVHTEQVKSYSILQKWLGGNSRILWQTTNCMTRVLLWFMCIATISVSDKLYYIDY